LLLAARERAALLRDALAQTGEQREHALEVGGDGGAIGAREGAHLEVLEHGHAREDPPAFRRLGDAQSHDAIGGEPVEALAVEGAGAAAGAPPPRGGGGGGGLAGAVGP